MYMVDEEDWVQPEGETEQQLLVEWEEWVRSQPAQPPQEDGQSCPN